MLMENGIWGAPDAFVKREGSERVWGHLAAQDAGEAHINIVLAAFVPASYLAVAPLSHWPDVLSAARHLRSRGWRVKLVSCHPPARAAVAHARAC